MSEAAPGLSDKPRFPRRIPLALVERAVNAGPAARGAADLASTRQSATVGVTVITRFVCVGQKEKAVGPFSCKKRVERSKTHNAQHDERLFSALDALIDSTIYHIHKSLWGHIRRTHRL